MKDPNADKGKIGNKQGNWTEQEEAGLIHYNKH